MYYYNVMQIKICRHYVEKIYIGPETRYMLLM